MEQFYYLDKQGRITHDSNGTPMQKTPEAVQQNQDRRYCFQEYKYGNIHLLVKNQDNKVLFDHKINKFEGQSVKVKENQKLSITIKTKIPKNTIVAPMHTYNIYIKLQKQKNLILIVKGLKEAFI